MVYEECQTHSKPSESSSQGLADASGGGPEEDPEALFCCGGGGLSGGFGVILPDGGGVQGGLGVKTTRGGADSALGRDGDLDGDLNGFFLLVHCGDGRDVRLPDRDRSRSRGYWKTSYKQERMHTSDWRCCTVLYCYVWALLCVTPTCQVMQLAQLHTVLYCRVCTVIIVCSLSAPWRGNMCCAVLSRPELHCAVLCWELGPA